MCLTINLDLDGVFADFHGVARQLLGYEFDSSPAAWAVLDKVPHLFQNLPLLPDALDLWNGLQAYPAHLEVLTALPEPTGRFVTAEADKRIWVAENLSQFLVVKTVVGGKNKAQLARAGDTLIDDMPRNVALWRAAGGQGIVHVSTKDTLAQLQQLFAEAPAFG